MVWLGETGLIITLCEPTGTWRAAAAALIYLLTPELMGDRTGHGPGEADWTGREKEGGQAEKCSYSSEGSCWVGSSGGKGGLSP